MKQDKKPAFKNKKSGQRGKKRAASGNPSLKTAVMVLDDKKAANIKVYDVREISDLWDYFVVSSGGSSVHIKALYGYIEKAMKKEGEKPVSKDIGLDNKWIILDYGDILVHIFDEETRSYYSIEKIWGEKEIKISSLIPKRRKYEI